METLKTKPVPESEIGIVSDVPPPPSPFVSVNLVSYGNPWHQPPILPTYLVAVVILAVTTVLTLATAAEL